MVISMRDDRMINDNYYVYKKEVDWSVLHQDVSIPVTIQIVFHNTIKKFLPRGQSTDIYLVDMWRKYQCKIWSQYRVESHHLDPFVKSLNNNAENQIIVCPNHHRIIHRARPVFDRRKLIFAYQNGVEDRIILNQYLQKSRFEWLFIILY